MKCPFCSHKEDRVVDSRSTRDDEAVRRRRECLGCGARYTTYEYVERSPVTVVKADGRRVSFDREKILHGLLRACEKRPVSRESLEQLVEDARKQRVAAGGGGAASGTAEVLAQFGVVQQHLQLFGERFRAAPGNQVAVDTVGHRRGETANARGNDRRAAGHRFDGNKAKTFVVAGNNGDVGSAVVGRKLFVRDRPHEGHVFSNPQFLRQRFEL